MTNANEERLIKAYDNDLFLDRIKKVKNLIEQQIKSLIDYIQEELEKNKDRSLSVFGEPQSRIKSTKSFIEKINRRDYINTWTISDDTDANRKMISYQLTDLIGFRINCFFGDDEARVYDLCKQYAFDNKFENIECNFNENCVQANGHMIYKWSGTYIYKAEERTNKEPDKYRFEVQIKSLVHNLWGEVEHSTIYKNQSLDINKKSKKDLTESIFNVMQAANQQLLTLYTNRYSENDLIRALFFEYTYEEINSKTKTMIFARHYENFFEIFSMFIFDTVKKYVACCIENGDAKLYNRKKIEFEENDLYSLIASKLDSIYVKFDLEVLFQIASEVIDFVDYEGFLKTIAYLYNEEFEKFPHQELSENEIADELVKKFNNILHLKEVK